MNKAKPRVVFFSRVNFYMLFGRIKSDLFECLHVVMNRRERAEAEAMGCNVVGCFEEEYESLPVAEIPPRFLRNNFYPDRFLKPLSLEKRREVLGKMITFWRRIFERHSATACVHESVSFEPEEVITSICKETGVKDLTHNTPPVPGYFFWKSDPYSTSIPREVFEKIQPTDESINISRQVVKQIRERSYYQPYYSYRDPDYLQVGKGLLIERFLVWQLSQIAHNLPTDWGIRILRKWCRKRGFNLPVADDRYDWKKLVFYSNDCQVISRGYIHDLYDEWCCRKYKYDNINDYKGLRIVSYPLHFEPEATTLYFAPECADQASAISSIARNLPLDTVLVVKEHPTQPGRLLSGEFQKVRFDNPNLCYLRGDVPNWELLNYSDAVATATSTLGWEALCMGKPVIVFGNVYYDKHPQITKLDHPSEIRKIDFDKLQIPSQETCELYLAKLLTLCHKGEISVANLTEENIRNIIKALEAAVMPGN